MLEFVDEYLAQRTRSGELAESSAEVIRRVLHTWVRWAPPDPQEWTFELVAEWLNRGDPRPSTRKSRLHKLRPFMRWMVQRGELARDPSAQIAPVKVPRGAPRDLTRDEVAALLAVCPDARARLIVILMVQCGLRCGDVARIRVEDVDARRRSLNVRGKGGRGGLTHWVPIPEEAWRLVVRQLHGLGRTSGPFIESRTRAGQGISPAHVSKLVGRWIREAGLKEFPYDGRSPHALRHTCAQDMLDAGAGMRDVQFTLGHSSLRSTEIYTRREPPGLRDAMEGRSYLLDMDEAA